MITAARNKIPSKMLTSRGWSSTTPAPGQTNMATATPSTRPKCVRWRSIHGFSLLLLMVLGGLIAPVRGGIMDFSPPGIIQYGTCAQPKDHESFHFEQFNGLWYQVEMVANDYMEAKKCITLDFRWNGDAYNVTTVGLNEYNERVQQDATIKREQPEDPTMKPYLQIWAPGIPPVHYHVVKTNYRHFACVYSCYELFSLMFEVFSVLSREPDITNAHLAACHRAFDALELDLTRLEPVPQIEECLGREMELEGSGGEPEHQDEEEEEDENALATLTSGEVNQRGASNPASPPRSQPATREGETMMEEEMEDLLEEIAGGGAGRGRGEEASSFPFETRNHTEVDAVLGFNEESAVGSVKPSNSRQRRPNKGQRRKTKGGRRKEKGEAREEKEDDDDSELYLDDLSLDSIYQEGKGERGRGGNRKPGRGEDEGRAITTSGSESLRRERDGSSGGVPAPVPVPVIVITFLCLTIWPRVPFIP